jgi:maltooligosyltrehalose synthase
MSSVITKIMSDRIIARPRYMANAKAPVGAAVWSDTWIALPRGHRGFRYRNVFTEELLDVELRGDATGLALAAVCGHFPVALLERTTGGG